MLIFFFLYAGVIHSWMPWPRVYELLYKFKWVGGFYELQSVLMHFIMTFWFFKFKSVGSFYELQSVLDAFYHDILIFQV